VILKHDAPLIVYTKEADLGGGGAA